MTSRSPYRLRDPGPAQLLIGDVVSMAYKAPGQNSAYAKRKPTAFAELTVIQIDGDSIVASGKGVGAVRFFWRADPNPEIVDLGYHGKDPTGRYSFWFKRRP